MKSKAERLVLIGLDAATLPFVQRFVKEGAMQHIEKLLKDGIATEAIPSSPVDTPTNWTTIATGANVNIHGVPSFTTHVAGENLLIGELRRARTKHSSFSKAEFFWDTAERYNKRSLIINYPIGWPSTVENGIVIGGMCPGADIWRIQGPKIYAAGDVTRTRLSIDSLQPEIGIVTLLIQPSFYDEIETLLPPLETEILLREKRFHLYIVSEGGERYDTIVFENPVITFKLHESEWSDWICLPFDTGKGVFRLKLARLSEDGQEVEIYCTDIFRVSGWSHPKNLAQEIVENVGPYIEGLECPYVSPDLKTRPYGPVNVSVPIILELAKMQADWFASTIEFLLNRYGWDILFMHYHLIDALSHAFLACLDPEFPGYSSSTAEIVWGIFREGYHIIDNMIGRIIDACADENTLIGVISDHGALPCWKAVSVVGALIKAKLLFYNWDPDKQVYTIDISRSKVVPYIDPQHIWVNLKGREPNGIVDEYEYERLRNSVIEVLRNIQDPETGEVVMALARRKEYLGLTGPAEDRIGDVVFFLKPRYSTWDGTIESLRFGLVSQKAFDAPIVRSSHDVLGHHTPYLPSERYGMFSNRAMLILKGPGVNKGVRSVPINLKDVIPTVAHLMGIPAPANSDGKVVRDLLRRR